MKKKFRYFSIFNHEDEQDYLQRQHQLGWRFVKVTGLGTYHFEECDPEEVIYQLDYNQEGSAHRDEYIQMFEDCGWEYIQEFAGYSYFRKALSDMDENESIFCDDASRLEMLERVYKGRMLPMFIIFSACLMPQFVIHALNGRYVLATILGSISMVYLILFSYCAYHYYNKKNKDK